MNHPVTLHFSLNEPIRSQEELSDICEHMEAAGFQIGMVLDSAEGAVEDRRRHTRPVDYPVLNLGDLGAAA